tara:strand:+ start:108 stop:407 length:300 start_codon:yes stop_codon:yes gene_type:complete
LAILKNAQANKLSSSGVFICEINVEACLYASNESVNLCKSFNEFPFSIHDLRLLGYEDRYSEAISRSSRGLFRPENEGPIDEKITLGDTLFADICIIFF